MPTIDELLRVRDESERIVQNQHDLLTLAEQPRSTEQCPSRQELVPILRSVQEMSTALAGFFEILNGVLNDPDSVPKLELMKFLEAMPTSDAAQNLMKPRHSLIPLVNAFDHNQTPTSILWEETFNLAIWYSEYRITISGLYYVIENYVNGFFTDNKWLWDWMKDFCDQHRVTALHSMQNGQGFLNWPMTTRSKLEQQLGGVSR